MRTWVLLLFCVVVIAAVANAQKQGNGAGKEDREKGKKVEGKEVKKGGKINRQKSNGNGNRERNKLEKSNKKERNSKKNEGKDGKGPQKAKDRTIKNKSERDPKNKRPRNGGKVQNKPKKVSDRNKSLKKKEGKSSKQLKKTKPKQDCPGECVPEGDCQGRSKRGMMCDDDQVCCLPKRNKAVKEGTSVKRFCKPLSLCSDMEGECRKKKRGCNLDEKRYKNKKNKAYCDKKSCYCCVKQCKSRGKCLKLGGTCMLKKTSKKLCAGDFVMGKNYCDGKKCGCCIPGGPSPSCKQKKTCTKEGGACVPIGSSCSGEIKTVNSKGKNYCKGSCGCCLEGNNTELTTSQIFTNTPNPPVTIVSAANLRNVHFLLWTRINPGDASDYELIPNDVNNLRSSPFDATKPTVMLTHGWQSSGRIDWILKSKTEFLQLKDCNFIAIDWGTIAANVNYPEVVLNTPTIGRYVATFVDYLYTEGDLNFTSLYVTGHSIGAHVVGIMGSNVQNGRVGRITGLDPAGPGFQTASDDFRIERSDAVFVDIIHTNVCLLKDICLGLPGSYGHVDFFPNGGDSQPGCGSQGPLADAISGCSHSRAHQYWLESINGVTNFKSVPCPDWDSYRAGLCVSCGQGCLNMGVHVNDQLTGSYFLETYAVSPYAKG